MFLCLFTHYEVAGGRDAGYREAEIKQILVVKEEALCFLEIQCFPNVRNFITDLLNRGNKRKM